MDVPDALAPTNSPGSGPAFRMRLTTWALWLLRVPCGEYGGGSPPGRWCSKRFGHSDSCAFDIGSQPLTEVRHRARGWDT